MSLCKVLNVHFLIVSSQQLDLVGTIIMSICQIIKKRLKWLRKPKGSKYMIL